jgi:Tol biopolymer transport system component
VIPPGTSLGHYQVQRPIAEGGMGVVYRARDTHLERDVAVKVLPPSFAESAQRLARFQQEARTAGGLRHPNLLAVFDMGVHEGLPFIVSELLDGETLRDALRRAGGRLPLRKAMELALQVAQGLAAAHAGGVVHRDLKPENLFVTRDGRVVILDFGLAKNASVTASHDGSTGALASEPGLLFGTVGYMAPEQCEGLPADQRADVFAFGAVFHEMLTGARTFQRPTAVETMTAILREEPPPLPPHVPPVLNALVRHCLEKAPEQRFQSMRDVAFGLEALGSSLAQTSSARLPALRLPPRRRLLPAGAALVLGFGLLGLGAAFGLRPRPEPPSFKQLTFRRGYVTAARFAPDGQTLVYSAAWGGRPPEVFTTRLDSSESRGVGYERAELLDVSPRGELAVCLDCRRIDIFDRAGILARAFLDGGTPRHIAHDVGWADWAPDGRELAVVRRIDGRRQLEYPLGSVLYSTDGWISHPRVSPDGARVAFLDHPVLGDDGGAVRVVERAGGAPRTRSERWFSLQGLAWVGEQLWFGASRTGVRRALHAVGPAGRERLLARVAGGLIVQDVAADGRALVTHGTDRGGLVARLAREGVERDLSWFDWSVATDLSPDGRRVLFHETGEGASGMAVFLGRTDGSPAVRLGGGESQALSPDGRWALAVASAGRRELTLLPTGPGRSRALPLGDLVCEHATFFPDGRRLLLLGRQGRRGPRLFVFGLDGGTPRPISPEGLNTPRVAISPDGEFVAVGAPEGGLLLYPTGGGAPRPVPGGVAGERPIQWSGDGRHAYVVVREDLRSRVSRVELATGRREPVLELLPPDPAGIVHVGSHLVTPDARAYVYSYIRFSHDLFLIEGLTDSRRRF